MIAPLEYIRCFTFSLEPEIAGLYFDPKLLLSKTTDHLRLSTQNVKSLNGTQKRLLSSKTAVKLRVYRHTASVQLAPKQPPATNSST